MIKLPEGAPTNLEIEWLVASDYNFIYDGYALSFRVVQREGFPGPRFKALPKQIEVETFDDSEAKYVYRDPDIVMSEKSAVQLMDSLWKAGVRPTAIESETNPSTISAQREHIQTLKQGRIILEEMLSGLFELLTHDIAIDRENFYNLVRRYVNQTGSESMTLENYQKLERWLNKTRKEILGED